jgi:hypothetical protein
MATNDLRIMVRVDGQDAIRTVRVTKGEIEQLGASVLEASAKFERLESGLLIDPRVRRELEALKSTFEGFQAPKPIPSPVPEGNPLPKFNNDLAAANGLLLDFSFLANDSAQFSFGLGQGLRAVSNQIPGLVLGFERVKAEAAATGGTIGEQLLGAFKGPLGFIAIASAAGTAATVLAPLLGDLFVSSAEEAKKAKKEYREALDAAVSYELGAPSVSIVDEETARLNQRLLTAQRDALRETIEEAEAAAATYRAIEESVSPFSNASAEATQNIFEAREELRKARAALEDIEPRLDQVTNALDAFEQQSKFASDAAAQLGVDVSTLTPEFRRLNEELSDTERELSETRRQLAGETEEDILRTRLASIEEQIATGTSFVVTERLNAQERTELELEASQIRLELTRSELRQREQDRQEASQRALQQTQELEQLIGDLRIEVISDVRSRELAEAERTRDERLKVAGDDAEARRLIEQVYLQDVVEINREAEEQVREEAAKTRRQQQALDEARAQAAGATEQEVLRQRIAFLNEEVQRFEEGTDEYVQAATERAQAQAQLTDVTERAAKRRADALKRENDKAKAEADREYQRVVAISERYANNALDAIQAGFEQEQRFTEASIELQRDRFKEEERRLRESLDNQEISRREYELRIRALREETSSFEDAVREDQLSKSQKAALELVGYVRQQAIAYIKAEIAKAAAAAARSAFANVAIPFPLNIAAAGAAIAAAQGLESVIRGIGGFAGGGFVGSPGERGRDEVPAWLGRGEAVLNHHHQRYVNGALYKTYGFGLGELFRREQRPHYLATGGFAGIGDAELSGAGAPAGSGVPAFDDSRLLGGLASLSRQLGRQADEIARMKQAPVPVLVGDHESYRIGRSGSRYREERYTSRVRRVQIARRGGGNA